ncbi:MAG: hypothetical protein CVU93_01810 [Firmicutes bacterium HGW-Firmicutes-18]|nr:MAG: hypothetical protein CVU93_01810 [Firmicutes bacterium HGW-Firmicutes-18]
MNNYGSTKYYAGYRYLKRSFSKEHRDCFQKAFVTNFKPSFGSTFNRAIGIQTFERTEDPAAYLNSFRDRQNITRIGNITLHATRHMHGKFSTTMFKDTKLIFVEIYL